ncbi:HIT family protein [Candidatus Micrarchaeota archaeon]|nr:HIT family protein [Candidatus Micrarchaeota archaeon]
MEECIFCKIIEGKLPCWKVYEDKSHIAFLDLYPAVKGHVLVIPKKHYAHFSQIHHKEIGNFIEAVQKVAMGVKKAMKADGINVFLNEGKAAGQIVFHAHFHIIPRYENDGINFSVGRDSYLDGEMLMMQRKLTDSI